MRYCDPYWGPPQGGDGRWLQATLRFEPPLVSGERVLVAGPYGEQLPLHTPYGVKNVQRAPTRIDAVSEVR